MVYTAYTEKEYETLPRRYRKQVVGVSEEGEILQIPLCPECGGEMMEQEGYLSCTECSCLRKKRILK